MFLLYYHWVKCSKVFLLELWTIFVHTPVWHLVKTIFLALQQVWSYDHLFWSNCCTKPWKHSQTSITIQTFNYNRQHVGCIEFHLFKVVSPKTTLYTQSWTFWYLLTIVSKPRSRGPCKETSFCKLVLQHRLWW